VDQEIVAILLVAFVHVVGVVVLVGLLLDGPVDLRGWWPRDDDGGQRPRPTPEAPREDGGLPLPGALPAGVRLRGPARLADAHRRERRPVREPQRPRPRQPAG
jgi:energy-converting hydrogenase Eha subunit F